MDVIGVEIIDERPKRDHKGKSIIDFPNSYIVIDIETTGLSTECDSIIEISGFKIKDNKLIDTFSSLVKPGREIYIEEGEDEDYPSDFIINEDNEKIYYVDEFITELTGITNAMLAKAPMIEEILPKFDQFIGNEVLIGHNVNFDINFLYDEYIEILRKPLQNDFIDTMRIAKHVFTDLPNFMLQTIAGYYSICIDGAHRAMKDCEITNGCYQHLREDVFRKYGNKETFLEEIKGKKTKHKNLKAEDIHSSCHEFDIMHPLYNKRCVFTGTLEKMTRREAMQIVVDHGGINEDAVTVKTNYLILGNNDYYHRIKNGKSNKQKRAETLRLEGKDIEVIPENVFYDMIEED